MKKLFSLSLAFLLLLSLLSCSETTPPEITDFKWQLASVTEEEQGGAVRLLYVSDAYVAFANEGHDTPRVDCTLVAKKDKFTITDNQTGAVYTGTYEEGEEFSPDATTYNALKLEGKRGRAIALRGADNEGEDIYTLSVTVGKHSLLFFVK